MDDDNYLDDYLDEEECPECGGALERVDDEENQYECSECGWTTVDEPDEDDDD